MNFTSPQTPSEQRAGASPISRVLSVEQAANPLDALATPPTTKVPTRALSLEQEHAVVELRNLAHAVGRHAIPVSDTELKGLTSNQHTELLSICQRCASLCQNVDILVGRPDGLTIALFQQAREDLGVCLLTTCTEVHTASQGFPAGIQQLLSEINSFCGSAAAKAFINKAPRSIPLQEIIQAPDTVRMVGIASGTALALSTIPWSAVTASIATGAALALGAATLWTMWGRPVASLLQGLLLGRTIAADQIPTIVAFQRKASINHAVDIGSFYRAAQELDGIRVRAIALQNQPPTAQPHLPIIPQGAEALSSAADLLMQGLQYQTAAES